jgi:hypothetical protein
VLGQIAKHSVDLAEVVVEAEIFPKCLTCLRYPDKFVQKHAATLVSSRQGMGLGTYPVLASASQVTCAAAAQAYIHVRGQRHRPQLARHAQPRPQHSKSKHAVCALQQHMQRGYCHSQLPLHAGRHQWFSKSSTFSFTSHYKVTIGVHMYQCPACTGA